MESCSWKVCMGAFISRCLPQMTTETLPAFTGDCYITYWSRLKPTSPYFLQRQIGGRSSFPKIPLPQHLHAFICRSLSILWWLSENVTNFTCASTWSRWLMLDLLRSKETAQYGQFGMNSGSTLKHQDPCEKDKHRSTCRPRQSSVYDLAHTPSIISLEDCIALRLKWMGSRSSDKDLVPHKFSLGMVAIQIKWSLSSLVVLFSSLSLFY